MISHILHDVPFCMLRIAMWAVLNQAPDALNLVGPDCSSWGVPARYTSMRNFVNPYGRMGNDWVESNNCLVSRTLVCNDSIELF